MPPKRPDLRDALPLTHLAFHILLSLSEAPLHGYAIVRQVRLQSEGRVDPGTGSFYSVIRGLSERRLIDAVDAPAAETDDRRRYYALTVLGRRVLAAETDRLERLIREVDRRHIRTAVKAGTR